MAAFSIAAYSRGFIFITGSMGLHKVITIVISPRDRYHGLEDCVEAIYKYTDKSLFNLIILDLGYPSYIIEKTKSLLQNVFNVRFFDYGCIIPMSAMEKVRHEISTKYAIFLDNDSRVTEGWLTPIIETGDTKDAAVVYPVILEKPGVDEGDEIRNHLFTTELRVVDVKGVSYLIEHKTYRRAALEELPREVTESNAFELHCVMFNTRDLKNIEIPHMTIREHLDIGLQLNAKGRKMYVDPRSHIIFDNLGTRAGLADLKYFNLRWNSKITEHSSRLFEKRWGYKFYSEPSIYNWAVRRKMFMILRWLHLPISLVNKIDRIVSAVRRRLCPIWDPLNDPDSESTLLYDKFDGNPPPQQRHSVN